MLFINPMWDNEAERIGKLRCTRLGYALHAVSDLIGFAGLLLLLVIPAFLGYQGFVGKFSARSLWLLAIPFGMGIIGSILYRISWALAHRRGFRYDYDAREANWIENGQARTYKYGDPP